MTIPGRLNNLNDYIAAERTNRHAGAKMKAENEAVVSAHIRKCLKGVTIGSPVRMHYRWYEPDKRRDLDNVSSFGRKVIQDALVKCGVLENDGWKQVAGFDDAFYVDRKNPRIEVGIEEVDIGNGKAEKKRH